MILDLMDNADMCYELHKYEQALEYIDECLEDFPNSGYLLYYKGICLIQLDRYREAFGAIQEAVECGYPKIACYYELGIISMYRKRFLESEKYFLEVLKINPNEQKTLAVYGRMLFLNGKQEKGLKYIERALSITQDDELVLEYAFYCYLEVHRKSEQKKILEAYKKNSSNEIVKLNLEGQYLMQRRRYKKAREIFRQALSLDSTNKLVLSKLIDLKYLTKRLYFFNKLPIGFWLAAGMHTMIWGPLCTEEWILTKIIKKYPMHRELIQMICQYAAISIIVILAFLIYSYTVFAIYTILAKKEKKRAGLL